MSNINANGLNGNPSRLAACVLLALAWVCAGAPIANAADRPNIIFVIVDDMGWADAGCYGSKTIQTPHIDKLAARGMRFTDAYSGCTVCAPARSTLMTGHHMGHTSVRSNSGGAPLLDSDVTLAEVLKKAGYATGGFGKWGLGDINTSGAAEKQGFDEFFGYYHQIHAHDFYPDYLIDSGKKFPLPNNPKTGRGGKGGIPPVHAKTGLKPQFTQYLIYDRMEQFIRKHKAGPFFCYAPWTPPHAQYEIPADDPAWKLYKDKPWPLDAKVHAAFVTMIDRQLGDTIALLEELGIADNTIVFFCSDNGASKRFEGTLNSSGPLRGYKRAMYEGGIRTPLVVQWPGKIKPGSVTDHQCYFPDVMPTLAELAQATANVPADIDGLSFLPTLLGEKDDQKKHPFLYWEWPPYNWKTRQMQPDQRMAGIRMGDWKAVRPKPDRPIELYNLKTDIGEAKNIASEHPDLVARFAKLFEEQHKTPRDQPEPPHAEGKRFN